MTRMTGGHCRAGKEAAQAPGLAAGRVALRVQRLERSIFFYRNVFGYRVVADARHDREPSVIMAAPGQPCLTLREEKRLQDVSSIDAAKRGASRLRLVVDDIGEARASLWDAGVPLARGTREPGEDPRSGRVLFVDDPDGHRVELAELTEAVRSGSL